MMRCSSSMPLRNFCIPRRRQNRCPEEWGILSAWRTAMRRRYPRAVHHLKIHNNPINSQIHLYHICFHINIVSHGLGMTQVAYVIFGSSSFRLCVAWKQYSPALTSVSVIHLSIFWPNWSSEWIAEVTFDVIFMFWLRFGYEIWLFCGKTSMQIFSHHGHSNRHDRYKYTECQKMVARCCQFTKNEISMRYCHIAVLTEVQYSLW